MLDARIKIRHLQCFQLVAEQRSVKKAANMLSISPPAVSKTIHELEEILNTSLFERSRKGNELTREGKLFFDHVQIGLQAIQQGANSLAGTGNPIAEIIRIGASPSVSASFVPDVLLTLQPRMGNIQVALRNSTTGQLMTKLREREFDLVICRHSDPELMFGLSFEFLYVDPLVAVVRPGHPLLDAAVPDPGRLNAFPLVLPIKGSINRHWAETFVATHLAGPMTNFIESLSVSFGRAYTMKSDAVWFVPWSAVMNDVAAHTLAKLPLSTKDTQAHGVMARTTGLMMRTDSVPTPAVQLLINTIRQVAAERRKQDL
jgi:LysR family pca operon transcriptional activator